jgi:signal transduction histidine kinase/CheY-like chemotaxis protein
MSIAKVLIVDEEPHILEMLKLRLEAADYEVFSAFNGNEAMKILKGGAAIDVALVDIMMSGMHGIDVLRKIKEVDPDIQVIMMTGYASLDTAVEAVRLGAYDYVKKPFENVMAFMHTLKGACERRKLLMENKRLSAWLKESNESLRRMNVILGENVDNMLMLHQMVHVVTGKSDLNNTIDTFLGHIIDPLGFKRAILCMSTKDESMLEVVGCKNIRDEDVCALGKIKISSSAILRKAMKESSGCRFTRSEIKKGDSIAKLLLEPATHLIVAFCIRSHGFPIGVIAMEAPKGVEMKHVSLSELYIKQAVMIIENARLFGSMTEMNRQLAAVDKLKGELMSVISDELKVPLTTINEGIALLTEGIAGHLNKKQIHVLEITKGHVRRLAMFIEDILTLSKIEAGKLMLEKRKASIHHIFTKSTSHIRHMSEAKAVAVRVGPCEGVPSVYVDDDKIGQVVLNLLVNAIRHSKDGGKIVLDAKKQGDFIKCVVRDFGKGIHEKDQHKLFKKSAHIHGDEDEAKRLGLGLALSKELVEMHGGRIWLEESAPGKGSTFSFTLPTYKARR